jgi:hypothetical protein
MAIVRQQIPNMHQWTNWEAVFSVQSTKQQVNSNSGMVFSVQSMPRYYKQGN